MSALYGAIEAGGTKMVMGLADENAGILRTASCPTTTPEETLPRMLAFFEGTRINALGLASFGPLNVHPASPAYGSILNTPKLAWQGFPLLQRLTGALGVPGVCDTDVNAAALAEARLGAAKGLGSCLYITVGTGIGGGLYSEGRLVHGMLHPEMGHILLTPRADDTLPQGVCPFHGHCAEGLASGTAMERRWGTPGAQLPEGHIAWDLEAHYLAQLCVNIICAVSPGRILLGGGVMGRASLYPAIRRYVTDMLNGYLQTPELGDMAAYIVPPALYPLSGLVGAALLAQAAGEDV